MRDNYSLPSHDFDRVFLWHYLTEPYVDVRKLLQQLIFNALDH